MGSRILSILIIFFVLPYFAICRKCDQVVKEVSPEILSYLGNVSFAAPGPSGGSTWTLYMKTTAPFTFIGGWDVRVESDAEKGIVTFHNADEWVVKAGFTMLLVLGKFRT
ncbi:uncharacterized protein LOC110848577 isoform X2 [Folsomia candida]|uniref:uncharacterized protein LOC110848577 isoform X2 n=1 Tax=Folsomia candida TaxID=158441 RepID=UPI00160538BD|nr:uncharacterized protein LOC110848577 isoform X2 [Folsomia candida]